MWCFFLWNRIFSRQWDLNSCWAENVLQALKIITFWWHKKATMFLHILCTIKRAVFIKRVNIILTVLNYTFMLVIMVFNIRHFRLQSPALHHRVCVFFWQLTSLVVDKKPFRDPNWKFRSLACQDGVCISRRMCKPHHCCVQACAFFICLFLRTYQN